MKPILKVEGVSKQYRIGTRQRPFNTLRDTVAEAVRAPFRTFRRNGPARIGVDATVWALKNVSFEVNPGEVIGIIGRNGAGKSTLLKILSRITEPTEGRAEIYGRIGSLLEVGTGFHPELTGRENIFMNGAILGMKRGEIASKFNQIVEFSEIGQFLDTPVKRYSSGMYTRLAFAVAAHLQPEILLVDEVLAVGDAEFQAKCLGKMGDVARGGRTVVYVSHNLASMANLCSRVILLSKGQKLTEGPASQVINQYITLGQEIGGAQVWTNREVAPGNNKIRLHAVRIVSGGEVTSDVDIHNEVRVEIEFWNLQPGARIMTSIHLLDRMRTGVLASANMNSANLLKDGWVDQPHPVGLYRTVCTLPGNFLNEGRYHINVILLTNISNTEVFAEDVVSFNVHDSGAMRKEWSGEWLGVVRPKLPWQTERLDGAPLQSNGEGAS